MTDRISRRARRALLAPLLAGALALLAAGAGAHPHIFIDGGVDFRFDDQGRLEALRITWIYDPLNSLFMLEELGLPVDAPIPPADRPRLAAYQTEWIEGFDGDSYLHHDGARIGLSGPLDAEGEVRDGQVVISFLRRVETPFRPDETTVVEVYDPTYFTAYAVTDPPRIEGPAGAPTEDCRTEVVPYVPTAPLAALQQRLLEIPIDEEPEGTPGALFAERVRLTCD